MSALYAKLVLAQSKYSPIWPWQHGQVLLTAGCPCQSTKSPPSPHTQAWHTQKKGHHPASTGGQTDESHWGPSKLKNRALILGKPFWHERLKSLCVWGAHQPSSKWPLVVWAEQCVVAAQSLRPLHITLSFSLEGFHRHARARRSRPTDTN